MSVCLSQCQFGLNFRGEDPTIFSKLFLDKAFLGFGGECEADKQRIVSRQTRAQLQIFAVEKNQFFRSLKLPFFQNLRSLHWSLPSLWKEDHFWAPCKSILKEIMHFSCTCLRFEAILNKNCCIRGLLAVVFGVQSDLGFWVGISTLHFKQVLSSRSITSVANSTPPNSLQTEQYTLKNQVKSKCLSRRVWCQRI